MKKLQVMIEDEHFKALKMFAIDNDTTLTAIVDDLIRQFLGKPSPPKEEKPITSQKSLPSPKKDDRIEVKEEKLDLSKVDKEKYFVIRKTHKTSMNKNEMNYRLPGTDYTWSAPFECYSHYDADGNLIPFRQTDFNGNVWEFDDEEIAEIEAATGKKVIFE